MARFGRVLLSSSLLLVAVSASAMTHTRRGPTAPKLFTHKAKPARAAGQRAIDSDRASVIQAALVKQGYLSEASGHWDGATESAMQKLQADNGWQTKLVPDARAIIKLGLGPSQSVEASPNVIAQFGGSL